MSRHAEPAVNGVAVFDTAWSIIARTHWDTTYNGVNWRALREELRPRAAAAHNRGELRLVLAEMVGRLRQSHFAIIPQEYADADGAADTTSGRAVRGGGGSLGWQFRYLDGAMVLTAVDSGGPAWTAGIRPGWTVQAVDGCPLAPRLAALSTDPDPRHVALRAFQLASRLLDGGDGDQIVVSMLDGRHQFVSRTLTFAPPSGTITKFGNLPPMAAHLEWKRVRQDGRTIGVITFNTWMPVLSAQFDAAMDSLRTADAIVLDLRGNLGGVGGMSMGIAGHFVDSVLSLGTMHQRGATLRMVTNPRRVDTRSRAVKPFAGPLALVVDELSASTTEIFAGGLQGHRRATVFGTRTAGQALPSVPERLPNGDILYHAIADFLGPTGTPVEGAGVLPDHVTPPTVRALVEGRDPALQAALHWAAQRAPRHPVP
ncbi:MAG TPA: S41 family peptidase [Gemmatimonas sp.]|uniref:S41 family peptidase n=1 Tax=Gemmatimonas sp. TaxID=1962908 RepID=UPI002ED910AA